jgi:uncharacterized membrane protein
MVKRLLSSLRSNIVTGVLVLAPIGAVLWIVIWLWNVLMSLSGMIPNELHPKAFLNLEHPFTVRAVDASVTLLMLLIILIIVWAVGLISRNYLGKKVLSSISRFLGRVPVLSTVYSTLEQLLKTFGSGQAKNFRRVVMVEYPRKGLTTLAFVTGERDSEPFSGRKGHFLTIYVPTTPNPTSGFYLTVAGDEVRDVHMTVEEALKEIISMGIVHKEG